jgi:hypothetical protein
MLYKAIGPRDVQAEARSGCEQSDQISLLPSALALLPSTHSATSISFPHLDLRRQCSQRSFRHFRCSMVYRASFRGGVDQEAVSSVRACIRPFIVLHFVLSIHPHLITMLFSSHALRNPIQLQSPFHLSSLPPFLLLSITYSRPYSL